MRVLLSAYACEPNKGSEPGVGWNWAIEIAKRGHKVIVVTRTNNKELIEKEDFDRNNINFIYHDFPKSILFLKKLIGVHFYYILWQLTLPLKLKVYNKKDIDLVHHITFGSFRNISYLPFVINRPFIFGPIGGGELTPKALLREFSFKDKIIEYIREFINNATYYSPLYRLFLKRTSIIASKTPETSKFIPPRFRGKLITSVEIGTSIIEKSKVQDNIKNRDRKTILFVGRFIYWKGINLVLNTYLNLFKQDSELKLIMIGKGDELENIKEFAYSNKLNNLKVIEWLPQKELADYYVTSSLFLFPSLHDSSGNVVLEALSYGLPVVCLDKGGPKQIVGENIDTVVKYNSESQSEVVQNMTMKIKSILSDIRIYQDISNESYLRSCEMTWKKSVDNIYKIVEADIKVKNENINNSY